MIRYFDTGQNGPGDRLGPWLDRELVAGIRSFRGQFGFFDGSVLRGYLAALIGMLDARGTFGLVLGANTGDPPTSDDLTALLPLLADGRQANITVVGFKKGLFHPKTIHIRRANGSAVGVAGSANFTATGLGCSIEAGLIVESGAGTEAVVQTIADAIDRWATVAEEGVHHIRSAEDIDRLVASGLVVTSRVRRQLRSRLAGQVAPGGRGTLPTGWRPPGALNPDAELPEGEGVAERAPRPAQDPVAEAPPLAPAAIAEPWCKKLSSADAQQPSDARRQVRRERMEPTRHTAALRLTKAGFDINAGEYFRDQFFGDQTWVSEERRGKRYERTDVMFLVSKLGADWEPMTLTIDHAEHRAAHAGEPKTVLKWGPELGAWLRENNQVGNWVVMVKDVNGEFWLSLQGARPDWAR